MQVNRKPAIVEFAPPVEEPPRFDLSQPTGKIIFIPRKIDQVCLDICFVPGLRNAHPSF